MLGTEIHGYRFFPTGEENIWGEPFYTVQTPNGTFVNNGIKLPFGSVQAMADWVEKEVGNKA